MRDDTKNQATVTSETGRTLSGRTSNDIPLSDGEKGFLFEGRDRHGYLELFLFTKDYAGLRAMAKAITAHLDEYDLTEAEVYWVQSETDPSVNYKVVRRPNAVWSCACPDQRNRGGDCKHIKRAMVGRGVAGHPGAGKTYETVMTLARQ